MAHLSVGGPDNPPPEEWIELVLCDRYKWTLGEVRSLALPDILRLLMMQSTSDKVSQIQNG